MNGLFWFVVTICLIAVGFLFGWTISSWTGKDTWTALGAIGSGIGGIGAFGAALVAWIISQKQIALDSELLEVEVLTTLIGGDTSIYLTINVLSKGKRPSEVHSISIGNPKTDVVMALYHISFRHGSSQLPINLSYGKKASFILIKDFELNIGDYINKFCNGDASRIVFYVSSTTLTLTYKPTDAMIKFLSNAAAKSKDITDSDEM